MTAPVSTVAAFVTLVAEAAVICRTMESVKQQIFSDFEILIVNDGSTDDSLSVLMDFLSENEAVFKNSVRLIEQENKGVFAARNQGIKDALTGKKRPFSRFLHKTLNKKAGRWQP